MNAAAFVIRGYLCWQPDIGDISDFVQSDLGINASWITDVLGNPRLGRSSSLRTSGLNIKFSTVYGNIVRKNHGNFSMIYLPFRRESIDFK